MSANTIDNGFIRSAQLEHFELFLHPGEAEVRSNVDTRKTRHCKPGHPKGDESHYNDLKNVSKINKFFFTSDSI